MEWLKIISLRYRSSTAITSDQFNATINEISAYVENKIEFRDGDYIFPITIDNIPCMCGIVLLNTNPTTECQLTVMTKQKNKPKDMSHIEKIHTIIEKTFVK